MAPRTRTGTGTGTGTHPRPPTLSNSPSPSPSLPSLLSYPLHDDASAYLSLTDFPTSPHTASPPSTRPSTAPPVESQMASQPCADSFDGIAARWAAEASKRAFARRLHEPGLASHSPTAGDGMVEVSGALRETHDALMRCLYAPGGVEGEMEEDKGDGGEKGEGGYRWSPSGEELERVYGRGKIAAKREEQKRTRSESVAGERTVVQMRGGGVHEFFGLKRKVGEAESVEPGRPAIISRPSDAFDHTGRARVGVVIPGRGFEELRTGASGPQDSRLLRVRQMGRPAPRSLHPNDGRLSSMAGSGKTASIAPEGTIASFYIGDRSHPGTLRASSDLRDSRVSVSDFPSPPPSSAGGYDDGTLAQKSSSTRSDQSGSTIRGVSLSVELPTTEQEQRDNTYREPSIRGPHRKAVDEYSGEGEEGGEPHTVHKLGSPMQSPVRDTVNTRSRCDRSFSTSSTPSYQGGSSPPSSGNVEDPQTTFFAPISPTSLGRSTVGSLRRNRRPFGQSQKAERPLPSVDEQDSKPWLFPPGGALSSDLAPPLHNPTASETTGVDPSDGSVWQGGRHLSVAPEDSHSEVLERKHLQALKAARAPTALRRHHGGKTELQNGEALQEVGESYETEGEAKERTEERFRDEVRRVWSHYQTRMRIINEDTERTPEDKDRANKEEHRVLELLIGQASTDTGFEQLHEPWQKDEVLRNMFGNQPKTSRTPSILRKANQVMKWFLAVPDDPELKTWSSRKRGVQYSSLASSGLQRNATNATSSHPSRSTTVRRENRQDRQEDGGVPRSPARFGHFHFAPSPPVAAQAMRQPSFDALGYGSQATSGPVKAGKMTFEQSEPASETQWANQSVASSETGWPTQSQLGGQRGA